MLSVVIVACLALPTDDAPKAKARPAAMVLDLGGKVEIKPSGGSTRVAEVGETLDLGDRLTIPAGGSATLAILGAGVRETIGPGGEATVGPKGCSPAALVVARKEQARAVVSTMKWLQTAPGVGRKAGVGLRGVKTGRAITPIFEATVADGRPALAWPSAAKAESYRVKLLSASEREIWRAECKEPRLPYPADKAPLEAGSIYNWEVTDQGYHIVASGTFTVASAPEQAQFGELKALAASGDRADRRLAALGYYRLAAYAEAIAVYEGLAREVPADRKLLADLYRLAGRSADADAAEAGTKPGNG